jgi:hypothetical protein
MKSKDNQIQYKRNCTLLRKEIRRKNVTDINYNVHSHHEMACTILKNLNKSKKDEVSSQPIPQISCEEIYKNLQTTDIKNEFLLEPNNENVDLLTLKELHSLRKTSQ